MASLRLFDSLLPRALRADRVAVEVPESGATLTYGELVGRVEALARDLAGAGLEGSRVALVMRNEPDALVAAIALAGTGACIPLNPAYTESELRRYLAATRAAALFAPSATPAALAAASSLGVRLIGGGDDEPTTPPAAEQPFVGFLFQTSGTTATPRGVPLTGANVVAGARNVIAALELTEDDASWLSMPLFHVHGLIGAALATFGSGGRLLLPSAFHAPALLDALDEGGPTWFTASPARHHALVAYAQSAARSAKRSPRFVRTASAPMTSTLREQLYKLFGAPIVNAYGMTEAAHQIASSSLREVTPAHVGRAVGSEVRILAEDGSFALQGGLGEMLVRGGGVMRGYDPPAAGVDGDGWLHTGDLGLVCGKGNLHLVARTKEIINRGGEKIAPSEIDDVLGAHPAVLEAAGFGVASRRLGEAIAAAVVLRPGAHASEDELQRYAAEHLAGFKVPREIRIVDALPRGATGKVQRAILAETFERTRSGSGSSAAPVAHDPPPLSVEEIVTAIWREVLRLDQVRDTDDFFELGGDSLSAQDMVLEVSARFGVEPSMSEFLAEPTVRWMASRIRARRSAASTAHSPAFVLRGGQQPGTLVVVQGAGFSVDQYRGLIRRISSGMPVIGLQDDVFRTDRMEHEGLAGLARRFAASLRKVSTGPYHILGYSSAGIIAVEVARALGGDVAGVILIDAIRGQDHGAKAWARFSLRVLRISAISAWQYYMRWTVGGARARFVRLRVLLRAPLDRSHHGEPDRSSQQLVRLVGHHRPSYLKAPVTLLVTPNSQRRVNDAALGWGAVAEDLSVLVIDGEHSSLLHQPSVAAVAEVINHVLGPDPP